MALRKIKFNESWLFQSGENKLAVQAAFDDTDWDKVIGINLTGVYKASKAVAKGMIEHSAEKL